MLSICNVGAPIQRVAHCSLRVQNNNNNKNTREIREECHSVYYLHLEKTQWLLICWVNFCPMPESGASSREEREGAVLGTASVQAKDKDSGELI